jgi:hypothetical protein
VLRRIADPKLMALVAWLPILDADRVERVPPATRRIPDPRALHFWDPTNAAGRFFARLLPLTAPGPAWDVYLLYRPGQRWGELPALWMHQLRDNRTGAWLNGRRLADAVREALAAAP